MIEDIHPSSPEAELRLGLGVADVEPETGEHTYWQEPPTPGSTDMTKRPEAIAALLAADTSIGHSGLMGPSWLKH